MDTKNGSNILFDHRERGGDVAKRKSPLRVEGEWSEHVSSKGLIYYYHCRTEVSQWRRPTEWTLPSMTQEEIKFRLSGKTKYGTTNNVKRNCSMDLTQDLTTSPKRMKYNDTELQDEMRMSNNNVYSKVSKIEMMTCSKLIPSIFNTDSNIAAKSYSEPKNNEANFNNDDMDISPTSSPLSSHSDECEKKIAYFNFESLNGQLMTKPSQNYENTKLDNTTDKFYISPGLIESSSSICYKSGKSVNLSSTYKNQDNGTPTYLTQYQSALATSLRSILSILQSRTTENKYDICLSVTNISELLIRFEALVNNGGTMHSYRSHRLQTQLLQNSSFHHSQDPKVAGKLSANINQIKELIKYLQDFIQDNYPHAELSLTPVSPNYSKTAKVQYYMQILHQLIEACLIQLHPQSITSPSSTSSPGSLKENYSTVSISTYFNSNPLLDQNNKPDEDFPIKREKSEPDKVKSILFDPEMIKFVSADISNTYRNQLADCYVQEAQVEYYKFVRLHSVLYPELACESKKLKALVRISEINTELFRHNFFAFV